MSQSDYLKYKKTSYMMNDLKKMPRVLDETDYLSFIQFSNENSIPNTKPTYNQLPLYSNSYTNFSIEKKLCTTSPVINTYKYACAYSNPSKINIRENYSKVPFTIANSPVRPYIENHKPYYNKKHFDFCKTDKYCFFKII